MSSPQGNTHSPTPSHGLPNRLQQQLFCGPEAGDAHTLTEVAANGKEEVAHGAAVIQFSGGRHAFTTRQGRINFAAMFFRLHNAGQTLKLPNLKLCYNGQDRCSHIQQHPNEWLLKWVYLHKHAGQKQDFLYIIPGT